MPKFKPGDTIQGQAGTFYVTIKHVGKDSYQTTGGAWMPINIVDRFWKLVDEEGEIVEE